MQSFDEWKKFSRRVLIFFIVTSAIGYPCMITYLGSDCNTFSNDCDDGREDLYCEICNISHQSNCTISDSTKCDICERCTKAKKGCNESLGLILQVFGILGVFTSFLSLVVLVIHCTLSNPYGCYCVQAFIPDRYIRREDNNTNETENLQSNNNLNSYT